MNNQAAQTMPESVADALSVVNEAANRERHAGNYEHANSLVRARVALAKFALSQTAGVTDGHVLVPREPTLDMLNAGWGVLTSIGVDPETVEMAPIYAAMIAAAQAASGGDAPSAASVSERARTMLADAFRDHGYPRVAESLEAGFTDSLDECALAAIEQVLTQQRGEPVASICLVTDRRLPHFAAAEIQLYDGYEPKVGDKLYTTPETSADAVRELAKNILNWQPLTSINKADRLYQILVAAGLPFESVTDELESLLGRGAP